MQTIKAKDPNIVVISGALSPTGYFLGGCSAAGCDDGPYLKRMVEAGALNYLDCVGVHANGYNVPPDKTNKDGYNDPTATFRGPFYQSDSVVVFPQHARVVSRHRAESETAVRDRIRLGQRARASATRRPVTNSPTTTRCKNKADWIVQAFQLMKSGST